MSDKSSQGPLLSSNRCCYLRLGTDIGFPSELKRMMLTKHSFAVYADYNYYVPGVLWYIALQRPTASLLSLSHSPHRQSVTDFIPPSGIQHYCHARGCQLPQPCSIL